ncbi:flagellar hook-basal body complex protein FliE [Marinagarivorans algicola]|uniref:flagellar hook-basal body complex protein FliE n=1 Tax=Marinagarivorans algicola TaxID=1513270 RepID=UPI0006B9496F|nr:flagellar hook-basal body complex protein FliE [Marinagarivorans algicola]
MTDRVDINRLLTEMRSIKSQTQAFSGGIEGIESIRSGGVQPVADKNRLDFSDVMGQAINKVNDVQQASSKMAQGYIKGDPGIDISQVMVASQKSSVAFQAATQVRNKLVEAYKDVMNMPI